MWRSEAWTILGELWDNANEHQRKALRIAQNDIEFVDLMPDDMVAVVRCKDCKHYHEAEGWCDEHSSFIDDRGEKCRPWEGNDWRMFEDYDFCSYGKLKDGD